MPKRKDAIHWRLRLPVGEFGNMATLNSLESDRLAGRVSGYFNVWLRYPNVLFACQGGDLIFLQRTGRLGDAS